MWLNKELVIGARPVLQGFHATRTSPSLTRCPMLAADLRGVPDDGLAAELLKMRASAAGVPNPGGDRQPVSGRMRHLESAPTTPIRFSRLSRLSSTKRTAADAQVSIFSLTNTTCAVAALLLFAARSELQGARTGCELCGYSQSMPRWTTPGSAPSRAAGLPLGHGYSSVGLKHYLADPIHFRAAFTAYAPLSDDTLRSMVTASGQQRACAGYQRASAFASHQSFRALRLPPALRTPPTLPAHPDSIPCAPFNPDSR